MISLTYMPIVIFDHTDRENKLDTLLILIEKENNHLARILCQKQILISRNPYKTIPRNL